MCLHSSFKNCVMRLILIVVFLFFGKMMFCVSSLLLKLSTEMSNYKASICTKCFHCLVTICFNLFIIFFPIYKSENAPASNFKVTRSFYTGTCHNYFYYIFYSFIYNFFATLLLSFKYNKVCGRKFAACLRRKGEKLHGELFIVIKKQKSS